MITNRQLTNGLFVLLLITAFMAVYGFLSKGEASPPVEIAISREDDSANNPHALSQPNFWDNQERAQEIISQLKTLNGLLNPYEDLEKAAGDLNALAELTDEDALSSGSFSNNPRSTSV